jgi:hypothetical protein
MMSLMICTEMGVSCSTYVGMRGVYRVLVKKTDGKRPLGRSRRRWENNIKMDVQEVEWGIRIGFILLRTGTGGGYLWMR